MRSSFGDLRLGKPIVVVPEVPTPAGTLFGPMGMNGPNYPERTPDIRNGIPSGATVRLMAQPTSSISAGSRLLTVLNSFTQAQREAGAIVLVPPMDLGGLYPATSQIAQADFHNFSEINNFKNTASKNILILAQYGWQTVTRMGVRAKSPSDPTPTVLGVSPTNTSGLTWLGFMFDGFTQLGGDWNQLAWSTIENTKYSNPGNIFLASHGSGGIPNNHGRFVEVVIQRETAIKNADTVDNYAYNDNSLSDFWHIGGYYGSTYYYTDTPEKPYYENGGTDSTYRRPHTDTIQTDGNTTGGGVKNMAIMSSNNCAFIFGNHNGFTFDHTLTVAGKRQAVAGRHPYPAGAAGHPDSLSGPGDQKALVGTLINAVAKDSIFIGGALGEKWNSVTNTQVNVKPANEATPVSGAWTVVPSLATLDNNGLINLGCPKPTTTSLQSMWAYPVLQPNA